MTTWPPDANLLGRQTKRAADSSTGRIRSTGSSASELAAVRPERGGDLSRPDAPQWRCLYQVTSLTKRYRGCWNLKAGRLSSDNRNGEGVSFKVAHRLARTVAGTFRRIREGRSSWLEEMTW